MKSFTGAFIIFLCWAGGTFTYLHYSKKGADTKEVNQAIEMKTVEAEDISQSITKSLTPKEIPVDTFKQYESPVVDLPSSAIDSGEINANSRLLAAELRRSFAISDTIDVDKEEEQTIPMDAKEILWENMIVARTFYPDYSASQLILDKDLIHYVSEIKKILMEHPQAIVTIVGHTDFVGNEIDNFRAGLKKARQIKWYLVEKRGIPRSKVKAISRGELEPVEENQSEWGRKRNDRVEIIIG